jgi:diamine N-acetyltransferase
MISLNVMGTLEAGLWEIFWGRFLVGRLEMLIRQGERRDAENLSALAIQVWLHTYATEGISSVISRYVLSEFSTAKFEALLSEDSSAVFVAEINEHLVGYAQVTTSTSCPVTTSSKVELATLYVQEPFVGKGVGHALLGQAEQWAKQRSNTSIWLTVNSKNGRAIAFYAKHGYTKLGITYFELGNEQYENLVLGGRDAQFNNASTRTPKQPSSDAVLAKFDTYPPNVRRKLLALRALVFRTAAATEGVGEIEETLKWASQPTSQRTRAAVLFAWTGRRTTLITMQCTSIANRT